MNILLTNDDGIHAPGLLALHQVLRREHQVLVVAPESEQSAVGHSITLVDPIRVKEIRREGYFFGYALSGTPADCVRIGVAELMPRRPDLVVSGINLGANVGINILYSGTVSAATEAAILGLWSVAFSLDTYTSPHYERPADFAAKLVSQVPGMRPAPGTALNVNIPAVEWTRVKGVTWSRQSLCASDEEFTRRFDPRGNTYYWRGKEIPPAVADPESDFALLAKGFITITPLRFDLTYHAELERLREQPLTL
ncbi:MAG: 5'/3'-nucleotidase SurE [Deltaproteobacteria bacterium]|nr:5'/3'-nucleotidase SurE [Deltaproteobacteria bacterium]